MAVARRSDVLGEETLRFHKLVLEAPTGGGGGTTGLVSNQGVVDCRMWTDDPTGRLRAKTAELPIERQTVGRWRDVGTTKPPTKIGLMC